MEAKHKETLRQRAKKLKSEVYALYFAYRDPRVPWYAKLWVAIIVGYAFSPIDFIPDFIPVLGYLDDVILIPLAITLAIKMIPPEAMQDARVKEI
ncbi:MAG: YkvA family protein, partial [Desulfitobacterium hafniense]|nr:YkvA family protein [Desulfitobacterium hafniense]